MQDIIKSEWEKVAFSDYGTNISYSHKDVFECIAKNHLIFEAYGVKPGDKIAICDKNSSNWALSFLSIFTYGAVAVPLLAEFKIDQIESLVQHSDSKILFTNRKTFESSTVLDKNMMVDVHTLKPFINSEESKLSECYTKLEELFKAKYPDGVKPSDVTFTMEKAEDLAIISYTSGSTGNPKGVMIPYRAIQSNTWYAVKKFPLEPEHQMLSLLPLAHMFGCAFEFIFPFILGCHIHFLSKVPSPKVVLKAFDEVKPFIIISVPLIIEKIIRNRVFPKLRSKSMRPLLKIPGVRNMIYKKVKKQLTSAFGGKFFEMIFGGAGVSPDVEKFLVKIKFPYTVGYGMTECAPLICYEHCDQFARNSCGKLTDRMELRILSDDPYKTPGEIVCRGMNVMMGYYKNPEATAEAIDEDGWLHTGDLGTLDKEGNLYIRGRKKNMLLGTNGQNVYPEEIEEIITSLDLIDETVVVQRKDKFVALIYTADATLEAKEVSKEEFVSQLDELRRQINAQLPAFSQLSSLELRDTEFEKTPKRTIKRFLYS